MSDKLNNASNNLQEQFAKAAALKKQQQQGSEMVKNDEPKMQPKPPTNTREAPDRQSYNDRLAEDRARAAKMNEEAKARIEQQKQLELKNDRDKNNDDRDR